MGKGKHFRIGIGIILFTASLLICHGFALADVTVTVIGPGGQASQSLPDEGGAFDLNLPLNKNAVNNVTVTAEDSYGNSASRELQVTQVSLDQIVVSQVTAERLSVEEVEQLVADGVIDLDDPENYNVSTFDIVFTIGKQPVPISIPIAVPKEEPEETGFEIYKMPRGDGSGGRPPNPPVQIVVFEQPLPSPSAGQPALPPIPGVIIIEGNIKSLKEFFNVRLLLMNTSGIFTLEDITADIEFPDGGLSNVLPVDGIISFGEILPGNGEQPGQVEKEFIIRGDEIGIRDVKVSFGGVVTGPGIPEDSPIPFNGSAVTNVEVKGPPTFDVQVIHPDEVEAGVPYELKVDITNTGDVTAMYASLDLDVGADAQLQECEVNGGGEPQCEYIDGPDVRPFGHILPGETVSETFTIMPFATGPITSCMAAADQNINLQVLVGNLGCIVGRFPPTRGVPDGIPTVSVIPAPNAFGISTVSPVAAFFSECMNEATIITGENGAFNVFDDAGEIVPGILHFETLNAGTEQEKTVAIWQVNDGITNQLAPDTEYDVVVSEDIKDLDGNGLFSQWSSKFTTTTMGINDTTPPTITLSVEPPVNPNFVLPGQIIKINAYASDMGSRVARVEMRIKDMDEEGSTYQLVDQKTVFEGNQPPYIFSIDSANLVAGHIYQAMATAYDYMGNARNATISLIIAASADPPTVTLPDDPADPLLQGISVTLAPEVTGGVAQVRYYLDGATVPYKTVTVSPYQASLGTLTLDLGDHTILAVAEDGLGQTGEDSYSFTLVENINMPVVNFVGTTDGAQVITGESVVIRASVEDPVGVASIQYFFDDPDTAPIYSGTAPILLDTIGIQVGDHTIHVLATNNLGISNDINAPDSILEFSIVEPPPGVPPAAPTVTSTSYPANGVVTVEGSTVTGARVDITNTNSGFTVSVTADQSGIFSASTEADTGDVLSLVAYDFSESQDPSDETTVTVPAAPVLDHITVSPETMNFNAANAYQDITVTGHYVGGETANLTAAATFSSTDPSVASVNAAGRVVALSSGIAVVTTDVNGYQAQVDVTVDIIVLTSITVDPSSVDLVFVGETEQLTVTAHYSNGTSETLGSGVSFVTGDPNVATVNFGGAITAVANGNTQISVYYSGSTPVSVPVTIDTGQDPAPTIAILSPADGADVERGDNVSVSVRAEDSIGGVNRIYLEATGETVHTDNHQIVPPSLSVTRGFTFAVSDSAAIGGTITMEARAEDTSGNTSPVQTITLNVIDETAPSVTISAPAQQTPYNYGDTVNIIVEADDAVGVTEIRYETTGDLTESGSQIIPGSQSAGTSFSFVIPYGVSDPNVKIHAYALDAQGNEGTAIPIDIILTGADITPPETIVTVVDDPGTSETTTITYEVTSGLDDLDYVLLYFRRNGLGTFNLYTGPEGNTDGRYTPQSGNTGTISFDSTRMGGDGNYEFYTVGVDKAGNREPAPEDGLGDVLADQIETFAAGTVWTVIDTSIAIGDGITTYDDQNLRITGAGVIVTISGSHSFHNIELLNGAMLTHGETTADMIYQFNITAWSMTIDDNNSRINVTGRGYIGGREYHEFGRTQGNVYGSSNGAGGSHGGLGGVYSSGAAGAIYGSLTDPIDLGSGGGAWESTDGGDGGGLITLNAINLIVDGKLEANGGESAGSAAGDGSGGTINITARTLSGSGSITANGGGQNTGTGGGGGRIAVRYLDMATMDINKITTLGDDGYYGSGGANGTVYLKQDEETNGAIVITGRGPDTPWTHLTIPEGYSFDTVTLTNQARVLADDPVVISGTLLVTGNSVLSNSTGNEAGLVIDAATIQVDEGSAIDVTGRGYRGGTGHNECGYTLGDIEGASNGAGGSYGGQGAGYINADSYIVYGNPKQPDKLGSGGGAWESTDGGDGGGRISLTVGTVIVNGAIRANGGESAGSAAGDGSGGAILIHTSQLAGIGTIEANGGGNGNGTAGGGGRVAVYCDYVDPADNLADLYNITALAGHGYYDTRQASAGTVYIEYNNQDNGVLYIDDKVVDGDGNPNGTASQSTPLPHIGFGTAGVLSDQDFDGIVDTLTTDGLIRMLPNGLIGLRLNPDTNQDQSFVILNNTDAAITVVTPNENGVHFADVAREGDTYAGTFTYDNLTFRRGGNLVTDDLLTVTNTMTIGEYGLLTHFNATTTLIFRLDLLVNNLVIEETGRIDTTGRGYIGGREYNESGRTQGNAYGSSYGAGGSHGGLGGVYLSGVPGTIYGSLTDSIDLGSGGGAWQSTVGGDGGGVIFITATDMTVNGAIRSNGGESRGSAAGDGSGGTVNIVTSTLAGSGSIEADGGGQNTGTGGGGGRIAIQYTDSLTLPEADIHASGGQGQYGAQAGNGMVFFKRPGLPDGELIIDGLGVTAPDNTTLIPGGYTFDSVILRNGASALVDNGLNVTGTLLVTDNSLLSADNGLNVTGTLLVTGNSVLSHSTGNETGLVIDAATIQIDEGSAIDVTGKGYRGGTSYNGRGYTLGDIEGASYGAGGSYGGQGAEYIDGDSYIVYGDPKQPDKLGSGGGAWQSTDGGDGGGRISLLVDTVIVNGVIRANGGESAGSAAGDGSGGAILIHTSQLTGSGTIETNGGGNGGGTAGGGGRVAVYCDYVDTTYNLANLYNITALAGHGQYHDRHASAGTVYIEYNNQDNSGVLYIDDKVVDGDGNSNGTASRSTTLPHIGSGTAGVLSDQNLDGAVDTLTTNGLVRMLPGGLIGLRINPDTSQDQSFVILNNTDAAITVVTPNENDAHFADVAHEGDSYAGIFTCDNLTFRRGGNLVPGDLLTVTGTMTIDEYGLLTHFNATTTFIYWLDLLVNNLVIEETGRIDTTGRGYIGGREYNESGRTQGNAYGSSYGAGGSHGGLGGVYGSGVPGTIYGSLTDPIDLGSGGGAWQSTVGGDGGGVIFITATDMTVNGAIRSNGGESAGSAAGDGSGGTVNIITSTLAGSGSIEADGGGNNSGVGGGGGRIAIQYTDSLTLPEADIHASGGQGQYDTGEDGTVNFEQ